MLEFDMLSGEFIDDETPQAPEGWHRRAMREVYPGLALLTVEEAEAERSGRR